ncbi:MAG TPA: HIT domain-containing protein [Anaerohalosphaeraceae bacterium]|nr:HIT domain-containing protein [Anaerohalosphaeraceae bacterium]HOL88775.1 HIT domain-containing protein [Anaerohalosphaeraceae bacterium]HPP55960.1 HIT domain-containing protein [Anaerohalosphaeraceae bacterium]
MAADSKNLWAPWRMPYIQGLPEKSPCFLCDYVRTPQQDRDNLVLWRTERSIVAFNRFPYNNGHLLIAPLRHIPTLEEADSDELLEMMKLIRESQKVLSLAIHPHGFNIGMNFGRCAGAGLPEHMHIHIVPRWDGDTNFMSVCSSTKVISQSMSELYEELTRLSRDHHLPNL